MKGYFTLFWTAGSLSDAVFGVGSPSFSRDIVSIFLVLLSGGGGIWESQTGTNQGQTGP